ncbi:hypothetical protein [Wielerella bovis]|nr:hypothetical protein [Wielerella bovis]ULJ59721.1 hypothetical protein MIS44_08540 [Wielerella bovis]ULJ67927.1 hypothetical protein MIS31_05140 [Wielerella bovis]
MLHVTKPLFLRDETALFLLQNRYETVLRNSENLMDRSLGRFWDRD